MTTRSKRLRRQHTPADPDATVFRVFDAEGNVLGESRRQFRSLDHWTRVQKEQAWAGSLFKQGAVRVEVRSPRGYTLLFVFKHGKACVPDVREVKAWKEEV